jgi:hypothetical protein
VLKGGIEMINRIFECELTKREKELQFLAWNESSFGELFPKNPSEDVPGASFELDPEQIYADIIEAAKKIRDKKP